MSTDRSPNFNYYKIVIPSVTNSKIIYKKVFDPKYKTIYKFLVTSITLFQIVPLLILSIVLKYEKSTFNTFKHKGQFSKCYIFFRQIYYSNNFF